MNVGMVSMLIILANGHLETSPLRVSPGQMATLARVLALMRPRTMLQMTLKMYGTLTSTARSSSCGYSVSDSLDDSPSTFWKRFSVPAISET